MLTPSRYQQAILDWTSTGRGNGFVNAVAGSGKSTQLEMCVQKIHPKDRILVLAFNTHIKVAMAERMRKYRNVSIETFNSLGWGILRREYGRLELRPNKTDMFLKRAVSDTFFQMYKTPTRKLVGLLRSCNIENPSDDVILDTASFYGVELDRVGDRVQFLRTFHSVYSCSISTLEPCDFDDQVFQPINLNLPMPEFDWIMVDESQDSALINILMVCRLQQAAFGRVITVGDPDQCQPLDSVVTMADLSEKYLGDIERYDQVISLDSKKEWRKNAVTQIHDQLFDGELVVIETEDGKVSKYTPYHKCLADFSMLRHHWCVYLMRKGDQYRIGKSVMSHKGIASGLAARMRAEGATAGWILSIHDSSQDAWIAEQIASIRYGLPQLTFKSGNKSQLRQEDLYQVWETIGDNSLQAATCLDAYHRDMRYPLISGDLYNWTAGLNRLMIVQACNLITGCRVVQLNWRQRDYKNGSSLHNRVEQQDYSVIKVSREQYRGTVRSLYVERDHTYVADGIATSNSIYLFRGAHPKAMREYVTLLNAKELPLNECFRCPNSVIELAKQYVPRIEAPVPNPRGEGKVELLVPTSRFVKEVKAGHVVLCRCVAPLVKRCLQQIRLGNRAYVKGRSLTDQLITLIEELYGSADILQRQYNDKTRYNRSPDSDDLEWFCDKLSAYRLERVSVLEKLGREMEAADLDDRCETIAVLANDATHVIDIIIKLETIFSDDDDCESICFMTGHKAKGLEAKDVWILRPDLCPHPRAKSEHAYAQENNLNYVMVTRCMEHLRTVRKERGEK